MDTSEQYIKMRLAAISDLGMGLPIECPCNLISGDVWVDSKGDWYYSTEERHCQLECQDQLQEMVEYDRLEQLLDPFIGFYNRQPWAGKADGVPPSMEQLWLAFVMKEKYNKTWDGEVWI